MKDKSKIKAKIDGEIVRFKFMIFHPMYTKKQADIRGVAQDYITHIVVKVKERMIFEFHPTERISKNPLFKFKCRKKEIQKGDTVTVTWQTLLGKTDSFSGIIK